MARLRTFSLAVFAVAFSVALAGCGSKEITSEDVKPKDPYSGMSAEQKIDAIRNDPKITGPLKSQMIADAQKEAGQPVTGR